MNPDTPPNRIPWPPIILAGSIVASIVLGMLLPLPWAAGPARDVLQGAGFVLIAVAILIIVLTIRELSKHETTVSPIAKAMHLVTTGPFAFSRNPIYLSNVLLMSGIGLAASNAWFILVAIIAAWLEQRFAILREEKHLEARFGRAWRDYARRVRRWI